MNLPCNLFFGELTVMSFSTGPPASISGDISLEHQGPRSNLRNLKSEDGVNDPQNDTHSILTQVHLYIVLYD